MSTLSTGAQGYEVMILQQGLNSINGTTITVDGNFGDGTKAAVIQLQTAKGLTPDGVVGPDTWAVLDQLAPQGMDISHFNTINWATLSPHIQFAYCKATEGSSVQDPQFSNNISNAKAKGIITGAYHYLSFQTTSQDQADNFLACGFDFSAAGTLPPALDVEETSGITATNRASCVQLISDWLQIVSIKTGRTPVIYTYKSFWIDNLWNPAQFGNYPLWIASYQAQKPGLPAGWTNDTIWQYFGAPDNPATNIADLDQFNGTQAQLKAFALVGV
jgi:lysozyme